MTISTNNAPSNKNMEKIEQITPDIISEPSFIRSLKDFSAGWIGGIAQVLTGQPFDTIKVRLQTQPNPPIYSGPLDCLKKSFQQEGIQGLYRGTLMPLMGIGLCVSIQFSALEAMKRLFLGKGHTASDTLTMKQLFVAGSISGLANTIIAGPVEHVRIRCQAAARNSQGLILESTIAESVGLSRPFSGPVDCAKQIMSQYGIRGLFHGQVMTMIRDGIGFGSYFLAYEYLVQNSLKSFRESINPGFQRSQLPSSHLVLFGGFAGVSYWMFVYPLDVIKSKIQTDTLDHRKKRYPTIRSCINRIVAEEGIKGFFKGFSPCILRAIPVNAATFAVFETAMRFLE